MEASNKRHGDGGQEDVAVAEAQGAWLSSLGVVAGLLQTGALREALAQSHRLVDRWPNQLKAWLLHANALSRSRLRNDAVDAAREATLRFPKRPQAWLALARMQMLARDTDAGRAALDVARGLGAGEDACAALEQLATRIGNRLREADLVDDAIGHGIRNPPLRPPLVDRADMEVQVAAATGPADAVVVFTGMADRVGVPLEVLDLFFAARGMTAIYCRDFRRLVYTAGIGSIGDGVERTAASLAALLRDAQARRVLVLGNSAGGFAAVRYGLLLRAHAVLAFGGPTNVEGGFLDTIDDRRGADLSRRIAAQVPAGELDLQPWVRSAGGSTAIQLHYGADMPEDRRHAEHLGGLPGVTLVPEAGCAEHAVLRRLMADGRFVQVLDDVLQGS